MKIFALQTDEDKLVQGFLSKDEKVVLRVKFSAFRFVLSCIKAAIFTLVLVAVGIGLGYATLPALWFMPVLALFWFFGVLWPLLTSYIDWRFDLLLVTTEEVVFVNQSSLFKAVISQMNLDNLASVASETQMLNLFPFGKLKFDLKEGTGRAFTLAYIPYAEKVASIISDSMVLFQRRRAAALYAMAHGATVEGAHQAAEQAAPAPAPAKVTDKGVETRE